jgi:outer membrane biosynthesis protein TonB
MQQNQSAGLSRRQMLARGATIGGVVWAAPVVTSITLSQANAAVPSGPPPEPSEPPKPPENPPTQPPEEPPTTPPTTPPDDHSPEPTPPAETPAPPPGDDEDQPVAGGPELPNTGPGDVARTVALGGLLAAGGAAAVHVASKYGQQSADHSDPGAPA